MKIPEIPKHRSVTREEALSELLDSIAFEESAISQLIQSEAKRIHAFTRENQDFPNKPSHREILEFCKSLNPIINSIQMKEWILYKKLALVLHSTEKLSKDHPDPETLL